MTPAGGQKEETGGRELRSHSKRQLLPCSTQHRHRRQVLEGSFPSSWRKEFVAAVVSGKIREKGKGQ